VTCGLCAVGHHERCNGLLKAEFGFCRCADHGHTVTVPDPTPLPPYEDEPEPVCEECGGTGGGDSTGSVPCRECLGSGVLR
jgi:hypothetical protein